MESTRPDRKAELRRALDDREFTLVFQPEYDLTTSTIVAAEALARWHHPERGGALPSEFIDAALHHGLIDEVTDWMIDTALRQLAAWTANEKSVAISLRIKIPLGYLARPGFVDEFGDLLLMRGVAAHRVCLEITESAPLIDSAGTAEVVRQLRSLGVSVAIDDLASGYSTLGSLRWLPVDVVKVDRSLITGIDVDVRAVIIVSAMVTIARELHVVLVAEGVENEREAAVLLSLECSRAQGNYLGRPMSGTQLLDLLLDQSGSSPTPTPANQPDRAVRPSPRPRPRPR